MKVVLKAYRFINLLSIDIAAGAIACALFFARLLAVEMRVSAIVSLGLTVWIIYTVDHLMDAKKLSARASTERHRFHQDHFSLLTRLAVAAVVINAVLIFFIKRPVLYSGAVIIALIAFYLLLHTRLSFLKEVFVAILYCTGVLLPSVAVTGMPLTTTYYVYILTFFIAAWINLLLFSWFDRYDDDVDGRTSFVTTIGEDRTRRFIYGLVVLNVSLGAWLMIHSNDVTISWIPLAMTVVLGAILHFRNVLASDARFRLLGDAVFLIPFFGI